MFPLKMKKIIILSLILFILPVLSLKCYVCEFNAAFCKGFDCYHNPDICSTPEFSTALVPVTNCPRNCYTKAVTNPAGLVIKWLRACGPHNDFTKGFKCKTEYKIGARIEQCTCDKDFCNHSTMINANFISIIIFIASIYFLIY